MGMFTGMSEAKTSKGNYLPPGRHRLKIEALKFKKCENPKSQNENNFIAEFTILESSVLQPGAKRDWVLGIPAKTEGKMRAYGDMKGFFACLAGVEPEEYAKELEAAAERAVGAENPMRNLVIEVECSLVKTAAGGDFTKHRWQEGDGSQKVAVLGGAALAAKAADAALPPGWTRRADGTFVPPAGA